MSSFLQVRRPRDDNPRPAYNPKPVPRRVALALLLAALGAAPLPAVERPPAVAPGSFERLARDAEAARAQGRLEEAARLYRRGLSIRADWPEGLWALGTLAYEQDRLVECRDVFTRLVAVQPRMAPAWALRGLCEYQEGRLGPARAHIARAFALGLGPADDVGRVALYHQALLLVRAGEFEPAIVPLRALLQQRPATPELEAACGLVLLRRPTAPQDVPAEARELVAAAGAAYCAHLARHPEEAVGRFAALVKAHPRERYLHYGWGLALAQQGSAEALEQFRAEAELFPDDVLARVELAFGLLARGREQEALGPAREAARVAPGLFVTHLVLGRALAATGDPAEGVRELERAAALAPSIPEVQLALARAYAQAGRGADAARARQAFQALDAKRRSAPGPTPPEAATPR